MNLFIAYVVIASPKPKGVKEMDVYAGNNKKMLNMLILGILKKYTDSEHRMCQVFLDKAQFDHFLTYCS